MAKNKNISPASFWAKNPLTGKVNGDVSMSNNAENESRTNISTTETSAAAFGANNPLTGKVNTEASTSSNAEKQNLINVDAADETSAELEEEVYKLDALLNAVAEYYQEQEKFAKNPAAYIGGSQGPVLPWQHQVLQECLQHYLHNDSWCCPPYSATCLDQNNKLKKVVIKFNVKIYWHLSKKHASLSLSEIDKKLKKPERAEIIKSTRENHLGSGSYASVNLGNFSVKFDENNQIQVVEVKPQSEKVVKIDLSDGRNKAIFEMEYAASRAIYQARVHAAKSSPESKFFDAIILPRVHGVNLKSVVDNVFVDKQKRNSFLLPIKMAAIMINVICAARHVHANKLHHGDIKRENCMLEPESYYATFVDFGFTTKKLAQDKIHCSPLYAAPEIILRSYFGGPNVDITPALDIYSLGTFFIETYGIDIYPSNYEGTHDVYKFQGRELNLAQYLNAYARKCVQDSNRIPRGIKKIILDMISWDAAARPKLSDVTTQLLAVIDSEFEHNQALIAAQDFTSLHLIFQTMLWNLMCTEVFIITSKMKLLPSVPDNEKQILEELERLSYLYEKFNDPAPNKPTKTLGQYTYEKIPQFAKELLESIEHKEIKVFFQNLILINSKPDEEVHANLVAINTELNNQLFPPSSSASSSRRMGR
jgi:serine/threonine protein kinase